MAAPIWQKNAQANIDQVIMDYMAGEDIQLDKKLILYDIQASKAHVRGLESIDVLDQQECEQLLAKLDQLSAEIHSGNFQLSEAFEDCHSAIECYLVEQLGELGKKIHTGRSRNDQVLVASRLYLKQSLMEARGLVENAINACINQAEATRSVAMPGYTHMQRAVPSTCGMWFASFAEAMIDNLMSLDAAINLIDANPLGTAAGYGVNLPLNRELTTKELEFARIQLNPIYVQNSRGKFELAALSALSQCLLDIRRFCWDLSLFTTQEFDFVELPEEMTTGSSIMPNKRNPDLIELMRASYAVVQSATIELQSILSLPSGYQRDLQLTKGPLIRAVTKSLQTLQLFPQVIEATRFKTDRLKDAIDTPMYATDFAVELSSQGMSFRTAYQQVVERYAELDDRSPEQSIQQRTSPGACADLKLDLLKERFERLCLLL
ncbi:argininosuccinate lyase [Aliikangiella coralliicola]|uniref:Argininosuccinate lyase n=1 Tax=Aliikangiella coralliicola TaxID=2592383 RepID=A0A545UA74_9GAMM|nr:argininosuccinate lyase [Aliikangiella coralliicola]TQV86375.1 argininosuccinate lyase [Aliikangiella coralliicola]